MPDERRRRDRNHGTGDRSTHESPLHEEGSRLNLPFRLVLSRSFIISLYQPLSKCIQHRKDEGGIRPVRREPLLVMVGPFLPSFLVLRALSVVFFSLPSREPLFRVDVAPPTHSVFTLDEGCVWSLSTTPTKDQSTIVGSHSFILDSPERCTRFSKSRLLSIASRSSDNRALSPSP